MESGKFSRSAMLLGDEVMNRLDTIRIIIFGVGGVGSWCAESLVRTGVKHLTIVDSDTVAPSNINRQRMATTLTIGKSKVEMLKSILLEINPEAEINAQHQRYTLQTAGEFDFGDYDYIIDCIDSLQDKMLLIDNATRSKSKFFSSMGAALKLDPTRIKVAEFRKVTGCPLARALRQRFKKSGHWPCRKFQCVYSDELRKNHLDNSASEKERCNGSLMHITASFGLTLAGLVLSSCSN